MSVSYLQTIVEAHRRDNDRCSDADVLVDTALSLEAPVRDFLGRLRMPGLALIAEVKRKSPSEGSLNEDVYPPETARLYESGGASCVSVLTDQEFFGGSPDDLRAVKEAVSLPVLRKDFTVGLRDVAEARLMGADAVLLIVAALSDDELAATHGLARELGLAALVEVHDERELERASVIDGIEVIGVNQRNLATFEITDAAARLRDSFPSDVLAVAESGIKDASDAARLADLGYDAILVGTTLMRSPDPSQACRALVEAGNKQ